MSTSIDEHARNAANRAAYLRFIADHYPDAALDVLWDGGPMVPVLYDRGEGCALQPTAAHVATARDAPCIFPFATVGDGDAAGPLYVMDRYRMHYANNVLRHIPIATLLAAMGGAK